MEVNNLTKIKVMLNNTILEDPRTPFIEKIVYSDDVSSISPIREAVYLIDENIVQCYALHEIYVDLSKLDFGEYGYVRITVE